MTDARTGGRAAALVLVAALVTACGHHPEPVFPATVNVGQSPSSPGWGNVDPAGHRSGFDHDLANWLGQQLRFNPVPVNVISQDREQELRKGAVTLIVATYSITDERRKSVGFAGPYMLGQQGIMVLRSERDKYRSLSDLKGKIVCATINSTSADQLRTLGIPVAVVEKYVYKECLDALHSRQVDVISTDQLLLYGLQLGDEQVYVPPAIEFGQQERYGIGLPKGDKAKCQVVTDKLRELLTNGTWNAFFHENLPGVDAASHKPDPNHLNPC